MTATTYPVRFCTNDFLDNATISSGSSVSGFPASNAVDPLRAKVWKPGGTFIVTASNKNIYINDGTDKTVALTVGTYTYSTLASHIGSAFTAASIAMGCSYSTTTNKFTITASSSSTLRLSQTSNAAWDMLGFTATSDVIGTSFLADESRIHTSERFTMALGAPMTPSFFAVIGAIDEIFPLTSSATLTLKFNNMPDLWDSPDLSVSLSRSDRGIFHFLDSESDVTYEYVCFEIVDRQNPLGPTGIALSRIWLGDYLTVTTTNIGTGFNKDLVDLSRKQTSIGGVNYFNTGAKYRTFTSANMQLVSASERRDLELAFEELGAANTFFMSIDPGTQVSESIDEYTFYARFQEPPQLKHVIRDYYDISMDIEEVV